MNDNPEQFKWPAEVLTDAIDRAEAAGGRLIDRVGGEVIPRAEQAGINIVNAFFAGLARVRYNLNGGISMSQPQEKK